MTAAEKGRALEDAVQAIEAVILEFSPGLREESFRIATRQRVNAGGVHHEIDILVTVEAAKGYTSTFLFECKNWEEAVGKNEIIVFAEKIQALGAQRGYFVAKSFTKDALAQADQNGRLTLLFATEHPLVSTTAPDHFHMTGPASTHLSTAFRAADSSGTKRAPLLAAVQLIRVHNEDLLLSTYMEAWARELYSNSLLGFQTAHLPEGIYPLNATDDRTFGPQECVINGMDIASVRLDATFGVQVFRPRVTSHYEVASRGRVLQLEPVTIHDLIINAALVQTTRD